MAGFALALGIALPATAEPVVVAALGDSLTQGYGLPAEQGFVPQLESWLNANGSDVHVINAGVSGDTTAGGLARIDWTLTPDVDALIVALGGNDLLRGIAPEVSRGNLDGILAKARAAAEERVAAAVAEIRTQHDGAKAALDATASDLSTDIASRALGRPVA